MVKVPPAGQRLSIFSIPAPFTAYLDHDVVTGRSLLGLIHPALDHVEAALEQVLRGTGHAEWGGQDACCCGPPRGRRLSTAPTLTSPAPEEFLPGSNPQNLSPQGMGQGRQLGPRSTQSPLGTFHRARGGTLTTGATQLWFSLGKRSLMFPQSPEQPQPWPQPQPRPRPRLHTSEDTRAELETLGTLSTMACFM